MGPKATDENDRRAKLHDRDARIYDMSVVDGSERPAAGSEPLDRALERLRLDGAVFLRAEYTEAWALDGQGGP
jgi:hypothetical protein